MSEYFWPMTAFFILISIALSGGAKNYQSGNLSHVNNQQTTQNNTQNNSSNGISPNTIPNQIHMSWGSYGNNDAKQEFIEIDADTQNNSPINITGYMLVSTSSNIHITIPQSVNLYFLNSTNANEDVYLSPGERAYIITGRSPITYGFHVNKCSGYLNQSNTFIPSIYTSCPTPRDEDLSSIPRRPNNNNCFDLINSLSSCQTYTGTPLTNAYSYECQNFINTQLNYQTCIDTHKKDSDFWSPKTWYVYLKHENTLWGNSRETLLLEDRKGKTLAKISR